MSGDFDPDAVASQLAKIRADLARLAQVGDAEIRRLAARARGEELHEESLPDKAADEAPAAGAGLAPI